MKILILLLFPLIGKTQTFEKTKNTYLNESYIRYYDPIAGILIQKVNKINQDTSNKHYEIGLSVLTRSRSSDDFMKKGGLIMFDDKTYLLFMDPIYVNYFQEGKHQYSIKHNLSESEFKLLQTKKIDFVSVAEKENSIDKWRKQDLLKVFIEIEKQ